MGSEERSYLTNGISHINRESKTKQQHSMKYYLKYEEDSSQEVLDFSENEYLSNRLIRKIDKTEVNVLQL